MEEASEAAPKAERNYWIDLARLIMAFFVVGIHSVSQNGWGSDPNQFLCILNSSLFRTAVPFFFLLTGYFAYNRFLKEGRRPSVFFKTALRYFAMYLFWIVLYLGLIIRESYVGKGYAPSAYAAWFFQELFLNSPLTVFWFLRASAYGLALLGVFFLWKQAKPLYLLPLALTLFVIGAFGDSYYGFLGSSLKDAYASYAKIFYCTRNMAFFGLPFLVIGCLVRDCEGKIPSSKKALVILSSFAGAGLILVFLESYLLFRFSAPKDCNFLFSLLLFEPFLLLVLLKIGRPLKSRAAPYLGDVASLLYFTHILFRYLYNDVFAGTDYAKNYYLRFFLVAAFALLLSVAVVATTQKSKIRHWVY